MTVKKFKSKRVILGSLLIIIALISLMYKAMDKQVESGDLVGTDARSFNRESRVNQAPQSVRAKNRVTTPGEAPIATQGSLAKDDSGVDFLSQPEAKVVRGKGNVMIYPDVVRSERSPVRGSVFKQSVFNVRSAKPVGALTITKETKSAVEAEMDLNAVRDFLISDAQYLNFPISVSDTVLLDIQRVEAQGLHTVSLVGKVKDRLESQVRLVFHDGSVAGSVELIGEESYYEVGMAGNGDVAIRLMDMEENIYGECAGCDGLVHNAESHDEGLFDEELLNDAVITNTTEAVSFISQANISADYSNIIDGVVGYTTVVKNNAGGTAAMEAKVILSTGFINEALANSNITNTVVTLLGTVEEVDYNRSLRDTFFDLSEVGVLATNRLLSQLGADYASVFYDGGSGVAELNGVFNVSGNSISNSASTVVHEFGHILGCNHAWADTIGSLQVSTKEAYYGWRFTTATGARRRTVMSYSGNGFATVRIGHFSNPLVNYPVGDPAGVPTGVVPGHDASNTPGIDPLLINGGAVGGRGPGYDGSNPDLGADCRAQILSEAARVASKNLREPSSILQPKFGEIYYIGQEEQIAWLGGDHTQSVELELYKGGVLHSTIASVSSASLRWFDWVIPVVPEGTDYSVRVTIEGEPTMEVGPFEIRELGVRADDLDITVVNNLPVDVTLPTVENLEIGYIYTQPLNGRIFGTAPNLIYVPNLGATSDSFTYNTTLNTAAGVETSETGVVSITVVSEVAHWPLDEVSGNVVSDVSGNGHDGTFTATIDSDTWVNTGQVDGALRFKGDTDSVTLPASAFAGMTNQMTLSLWIYGEADHPQNDNLFHMIDANGDTIMTMLLGAQISSPTPIGNYWYSAQSGDFSELFTAATESQYKGQWNHYVFTKNTELREMKLYINGVLSAAIVDEFPISGTAEAYLGSYNSTLSSYHGMIDNVRLYDVGLSAAAVARLYELESGVGLVAEAQTVITTANEDKPITLSSSSSLVNYTVVQSPLHGVLSGTAPNLIYTPDIDYDGLDSFTFIVNDGQSNSEEATVSIQVLGEDHGLLAHWALDETDGTEVRDSSDNGHHATRVGANWVKGYQGGALDFNAGSDSVTLPASAFGDITNEITVMMWVYGDTTQPRIDSVLYATNSAGARMLNIHLPWSNSTVFWDAGSDRISKLAIPDNFMGKWNHWAFTKNGSTGMMKIYLNGVLWHSGTGNTGSMEGITNARLGSQISTRSYDGLIDDVRLYNIELAPDEINNLFTGYYPYLAFVNDFGALTDTSPNGDPDNDGIATILEYVLNGDPTVGGDTNLPIIETDGENIVFSFTRLASSAFDTEQVFQYSSTLNPDDWTDISITGNQAAEVTVGPEIDRLETVTVTMSRDMVEGGKMFVRLKVSE